MACYREKLHRNLKGCTKIPAHDSFPAFSKWSAVFEHFFRPKNKMFVTKGPALMASDTTLDDVRLYPWQLDLDDFLLEVGQRAWLEKGKDWNILELLEATAFHVNLEEYLNGHQKDHSSRLWEPFMTRTGTFDRRNPYLSPSPWGRDVPKMYFQLCLQEILNTRCSSVNTHRYSFRMTFGMVRLASYLRR